ncbi:hypothetical protein ACHAXR_008278 [Thalassiosira sp. AJA248-18]
MIELPPSSFGQIEIQDRFEEHQQQAKPLSRTPTTTMAEGGIYPWKIQKIVQPHNGLPGTCRFADLSKPLPDPPKGHMWAQDESSREWKLVPVTTGTADDVVAFARRANATDVADATIDASGVMALESAVAINSIQTTSRYHEVLPTDTFQGICLRYKVTPTELRRANKMLGSNLKLAPEKLLIPSNNKNQQLKTHGVPTKEEMIVSLQSKVSRITKDKLTYSEARAYLEIADWDVNCAVEHVNEDFGWSASGQA